MRCNYGSPLRPGADIQLAQLSTPKKVRMHLWASYLQISQRDFAISNIVIDVFDVLARLNLAYVPDDLVIPQLSDDKIPLDVRIRIGRMSDLERKLVREKPISLVPAPIQ
jgi:hypothetical protein